MSSPCRFFPRAACFLVTIGLGVPCAHAQAERGSLEVSLGWNYAAADQGDGFAHVNGWYGVLNWPVLEHVGLALSHESYWGAYRGTGLNQHVYLLGATLKPRKGEHRINPFLQPFGGDTRVSYAGQVEDQPTFELVAGADIPLRGRFSLEVIPAEYAYTHGSAGNLSSYQAAAGFEYTFGKR